MRKYAWLSTRWITTLGLCVFLSSLAANAEPGDVRIVPSRSSQQSAPPPPPQSPEPAAWPLASAASESPPRAADALREAEEAAARAEEAAIEARAFAESLAEEAAREAEREAALEAERAAAQAAAARESAKAAASAAELEAAVERAERAADEAWVAARAAERAAKDSRVARQTGPYVGAAFVYAAEEFDDDLVVKSSLGAAGFAGWRFIPQLAAELRFTGFEGFDIQASNGEAEIDGYAVTLNAKVYPITTRIQPFVVLGIGATHLESVTRLNDGRRFRDEETDVVLRFGAGVDLPLSDYLSLNLGVAYLAPADDLSDLDVTELSTGLTYRF